MQRITVTVDDDLVEQFDGFMRARGYTNRSEAFRDLLRERLERDRVASGSTSACVACLTYVYDHAERELPKRLAQAQHERHDLGVASLHVHLDHDTCMEAVALRGPIDEVRSFADGITAQRGVRHGHLWLVPAEVVVEHHSHGPHEPAELPHIHTRPRS